MQQKPSIGPYLSSWSWRKKKTLTIQSKFNLEERRCLQAEESLKEERLKNKKLQNLLQYYKNRLKSAMANRLTTEVCGSTNDTLDFPCAEN